MAILDPATMDAVSSYKLLIGCVVPRPIAWVSTRSAEGIDNLAPFSFFTVVSRMPPMMSITVEPRVDGAISDTLSNLRTTRELVVNFVSLPQVDAMHASSATYPPTVDEFDEVGLAKVASDLVKPSRVSGSLVSMECKVRDIVPMGDVGGNLVIARVVRFHVSDSVLLERNRIDVEAMRPVGRVAAQYAVADQLFSVKDSISGRRED